MKEEWMWLEVNYDSLRIFVSQLSYDSSTE